MSDHARTETFGTLPTLLVMFGAASLINGSLTQEVGIPLGATVTASLLAMMLAGSILRGYAWRRSAFALYFPIAPLLLWSGGDHRGFFFDHGGTVDLLLAVAGILLYIYGVVRCVTARSYTTAASSPDGPNTFGALGSIGILVVASFMFAWWWTNTSAAFDLLASGDLEGVGVCILFLLVAVALGGLALAIWWRPMWRAIAGTVVVTTGTALFLHAVYYSLATFMVHVGEVVGEAHGQGRSVPDHVFAEALVIIIGRFVFAIVAVSAGVVLIRSAPQRQLPNRPIQRAAVGRR